ncbi:transposase [Gudongella sp. DL1XJH-153]|uniref:transposase n=1 Tax=Gudongella sp. DL1XJH-153 TaxID=3409804 RepID=UPI003BB62C78
MRKSKISGYLKVKYVEEYKAGKISINDICDKLGVADKTVQLWINNYDVFGASNIESGSTNAKYTIETKVAAVKDYLDGKGSLQEISAKYKIRSKTQLRTWIKLYNGHKELRSTGGKGSEIYMTKGRSTTLNERIEIVSYCIAQNKDYTKTMEKYKVSYQQIYSWVKKYEKNGVDGLIDKRGKKKPLVDMTEVERLRAANKLLQSEIEQKSMEIDLLKKLEELERRRR